MAFVCLVVYEKKMFEKNGYIHVYSSGAGADNPPGVNFFFKNKNSSVNLVIWCKFFPLIDFVTVFPIQTRMRPNLTLPYNRSRSTQGHHLYKLCRARVPNAQCWMPSFKIIGLLVLEKKIFKGFTIYGHGSHLGHVTKTYFI